MKTQFRIFVLSILLLGFMNCQQDKTYDFALIEAEIQPYLELEKESVFQESDTLVIYDTTFFNKAITTLAKYANHLESKDSINNKRIINQLDKIEREKIQSKNPNLYIPTEAILNYYNNQKLDNKTKIEQIKTWLLALPIQFAAAKFQLEQPNSKQTKVAIQQLEKLYFFINNEIKPTSKQDFEVTELAIKDYLAFLQSKLNNGEVE